jgi:hypothetical protein
VDVGVDQRGNGKPLSGYADFADPVANELIAQSVVADRDDPAVAHMDGFRQPELRLGADAPAEHEF